MLALLQLHQLHLFLLLSKELSLQPHKPVPVLKIEEY